MPVRVGRGCCRRAPFKGQLHYRWAAHLFVNHRQADCLGIFGARTMRNYVIGGAVAGLIIGGSILTAACILAGGTNEAVQALRFVSQDPVELRRKIEESNKVFEQINRKAQEWQRQWEEERCL